MDKLLMYLGEDYKVNDDLIIKCPSIIDIARFGEAKYFNTVNILCSIPSEFKSELWDLGLDYGKVNDFDFFYLVTRSIGTEDTKLLLGEDISFSRMEQKKLNDELILYDAEKDIVITETDYNNFVAYLREMHNVHPKKELAANKATREILIAEDRDKKRRKAKEEPSNDSFLLPLLSSMINSAGFKYDINSIKNLGIYAFMDSVRRIQAIHTATAITNGMYCGMVDMSKNQNLINQLNWLRDLSGEIHHSSNVRVSETKS